MCLHSDIRGCCNPSSIATICILLGAVQLNTVIKTENRSDGRDDARQENGSQTKSLTKRKVKLHDNRQRDSQEEDVGYDVDDARDDRHTVRSADFRRQREIPLLVSVREAEGDVDGNHGEIHAAKEDDGAHDCVAHPGHGVENAEIQRADGSFSKEHGRTVEQTERGISLEPCRVDRGDWCVPCMVRSFVHYASLASQTLLERAFRARGKKRLTQHDENSIRRSQS